MIYTVTLNPALDYVIQIDHFELGVINRNQNENVYYGGKGINVSGILNELGIRSTALGFIAGFTGDSLEEGLRKNGISTDFIRVRDGMTRINVKVKSEEETEINGKGPQITEADFMALLKQIQKLNTEDIVVLSGSIPSCMKEDTYERIIRELPAGVRFLADAEKKLLLNVLPYRPFLIKPNVLELAELFETEFHSREEIIGYARRLQEQGAVNVLVSMAKDGAVLLDETGTVHYCAAASGTVVNSVGAGDSMVAGFLAGFLKTGDYAYALKLGTACGGATAFHSGLATGEEINEVLNRL